MAKNMYQKRIDRKNKSEEKTTTTNINWYPGHMVKTINELKVMSKLIDIVIEVLDARVCISSRNLVVDEIFNNKPKIVVLNKSDLSDITDISVYKKYFNTEHVILVNSSDKKDITKLITEIKRIGNSLDKYKNKDIEINNIIRVAIFGIPNVGKSTIINKLSNKQRVIVGNKPGVTKANKWIRIDNNIELLDTPGLLWPRLNENDVGIKLALTGNIKQDILDVYDLSLKGIDYLINNLKYKDMLINKYKLGNIDELKNYEILELIGRKRGCIISGSEVDLNRTSCLFLDEIKNGKIGKFNLDENLID